MKNLKLENLTAIVDIREENPWDLSPMATQTGTLAAGEYSVRGLEHVIAIKRKSLSDFVDACMSEREQFQRDLDRLRSWAVSAVIIEASWRDLEIGQWQSNFTPKQVQALFASSIADGHRLILGHDAEASATMAKGIMFHAVKHRIRESCRIFKNSNFQSNFQE